MLPSFAKHTIKRLRAATKTLRGQDIPEWSLATELEISGCLFVPASTSLIQDGRVLGISDGDTCYVPTGSDVKAGDRIVFSGKTYTIMGEPRVWPSPTGLVEHIELDLERWQG